MTIIVDFRAYMYIACKTHLCIKNTATAAIGTTSVNSAEFRGIRPWMYIEDLL